VPTHICAVADMKGEGQGQGQIFPTVAAKNNAIASATQFLLNFACFGQAKSGWNGRSRIRPKVNRVQLLRIWFCFPFLGSVLSEKRKTSKNRSRFIQRLTN
jgi:hypothetical protein